MSNFSVEYSQGAKGPGQITFTLDGLTQTLGVSGRLDSVGSRVVSPPFTATGNAVVVECVRTSTDAMRVAVRVSLPGADQGNTAPDYERVIEDVPLSFS